VELECETVLVPKPLERLAAKTLREHLNSEAIYTIRLRNPGASELDSRPLLEAARKFSVTLKELPSVSPTHADFVLSGKGGAILQALVEAAQSLRPNSLLWLSPEERFKNPVSAPLPEGEKLNNVALTPLRDLDLSPRTRNRLVNENLVFVGDLVHRTRAELKRIVILGETAIVEIEHALARLGMKLGMEIPEWPPSGLDNITMNFATSLVPKFEMNEWLKREPAVAQHIFTGNSNGLPVDRPMAVMRDANTAYIFMNFEFFQRTEPKDLVKTIRRTLFSDETLPGDLANQLKEWKSKGGFETASVHSLVGERGQKKFAEASSRQEPFFAVPEGGGSLPIVIFPVRITIERKGGDAGVRL
jgi:hypothetical protein